MRRSKRVSQFLTHVRKAAVGLAAWTMLVVCLKPASASAWDPPTCNSPRVRREWRTLSPEEQQTYLKAVRKLMAGPFYNAHSKLHGDLARSGKSGGYIHGSPHFLPWHRWFIWRFEEELRKIDSSIALPYWDSAFDSQAPELAPVWGDDMFGGNGVGKNGCVATGIFKDWEPQHPQKSCLKRRWSSGNKISGFLNNEQINTALASTHAQYSKMSSVLESNVSGRVYDGIGGSMNSPNDPLFYLHHSNIDRYWWLWQQASPKNFRAYDGKRPDGSDASRTDLLFELPDGLKIKVEEMFDIKKLCYTYKDMTITDEKVPPLPSK